MYSIEIIIPDNIKNLPNQGEKIAKRTLDLTSNELVRNLKITTPIKYGNARAGWHDKPVSDMEKVVYNDVKYAKFLNDGTGIYGPYNRPIMRTSKKGLKFKVYGGIKPFEMVKK